MSKSYRRRPFQTDNRRLFVYWPPTYQKPRLSRHGSLGSLIRGASWKGIDSIGEFDPHENYPR